MQTTIIEKIFEFYLKLRLKFKSIDSIVDVFGTMQQAEQVLIFLPDKLEDFGIARHYLGQLRSAFSNAKITLVLRHNYITLLEDSDREAANILAFKSEHFTYFGLPGQKIVSSIKKLSSEIIVDLNYDFHLNSAYLGSICGSPLRICLSNKHREPFFNFQVEVNPQVKLDKKYQMLLRYITFRPSQAAA